MDVLEPTFLRGEAARRLLAWMWIGTYEYSFEGPLFEAVDKSAQHGLSPVPKYPLTALLSTQREDRVLACSGESRRTSLDEVTLHHGKQLLDTGLYHRSTITLGPSYNNGYTERPTPACLQLSAIDTERWRLAAPLLNDRNLSERIAGWPIETEHPSNWPDVNSDNYVVFRAIFVLAGALYEGCMHWPGMRHFAPG